MKLFDHQETAYKMATNSIRAGLNRPIIAAPTAFGKTVLAGAMLKSCQDKGRRGWFFCDRIQLVNQTIEKFTQMGINFGVRQAEHELSNAQAPIQIASIQTVQAMVNKHNGRLPEFDFAIVDEAHTQWELIKQIIERYNNIPIIGLTATPYSKGLGKMYNNLLVPITPRELLAQGYLTPVKYFGGEHVDLSKIRSVDANTFSPGDLENETDEHKEILTGCIIKNWLEFGENSQTIAFSPSLAQSQYLVEKFNRAGITAEHIDCYTPDDEKKDLIEAHNAGEFKILSCSRLLGTGYDSPTTVCIIDCFPTKSITTYAQRIGRVMRTSDGKPHAIYLDHAGNFDRFGYAEDIVPTELHDGEKPHREQDLATQKDKKEAKVRDCHQCFQKMQGCRCLACGYQISKSEELIDDGSMLKEINEGTKANKQDPMEAKQRFLDDMFTHQTIKQYKKGYAWRAYFEKYGVYPTGMQPNLLPEVGEMGKKWIKYKNIKHAKGKVKGLKILKEIREQFND